LSLTEDGKIVKGGGSFNSQVVSDLQHAGVTSTKKSFLGWKVLTALFVVGAIGPMARYSLTAFFPAISTEMGWSRSEIGLAQSLCLWVYSLLSILAGWMVDRIGSRKTIFIGGVFCLGGWFLFSSVTELWQLYIYYGVIMAVTTANTHLVPTQATSRKWFVKRAGLAGGIVGSAFATGNAIISPLLTSTSSMFGWRAVSIACGLAFSLPILLLAYFVIRDTPESVGQNPDGVIYSANSPVEKKAIIRNWTVKEALKTPQLWLLFAAYGLSGLVVNATQAHLVIWAADMGSSIAAAGLFVTLYNGPSILARIGGGWLADKYGKRRLMIIGAFFSALVMVFGWLAIHTETQLLIFAPILGIGTSLATAVFAPYIGDLFGRENVGSLFAILTLGWGFIGGFGPIIWGIVYDATGSYGPALLMSAVSFSVALLALLLVRPIKEAKGD
jgi:MFS transporter, OFA family, oxalate/formate antiporter